MKRGDEELNGKNETKERFVSFRYPGITGGQLPLQKLVQDEDSGSFTNKPLSRPVVVLIIMPQPNISLNILLTSSFKFWTV